MFSSVFTGIQCEYEHMQFCFSCSDQNQKKNKQKQCSFEFSSFANKSRYIGYTTQTPRTRSFSVLEKLEIGEHQHLHSRYGELE